MDSKIYDYSLTDTDSPIGESSSMDFSESTSAGIDFGEKFVEILQAININEELLPPRSDINDLIHYNPGSEEFSEWFCEAVNLSNIVTEEELNISYCKNVSDEDIDEYLKSVLGNHDTTIHLTEETINKLIAEEAFLKEKITIIEKIKQNLRLELNDSKTNESSLSQLLNQLTSAVKKETDEIMKLSFDFNGERDELLETIKHFISHTCQDGNEEVNDETKFFSQIDFTDFDLTNAMIYKEFSSSLAIFSKALVADVNGIFEALEIAMEKLNGPEKEKNKVILTFYHEYCCSLYSQIKQQVDSATHLLGIVSMWHNYNRALSALIEMERHKTILTESLIKYLESSILSFHKFDLPIMNSSLNEIVDSTIIDVSTLNEALVNSEDFVTVESFLRSLKSFSDEFIKSEEEANKFIEILDKLLIEEMNIIKQMSRHLFKTLEDYTGERQSLYDCKDKLIKIKGLIDQLNFGSDKKVKKKGKDHYGEMLLMSITDPQQFLEKIKRVESKIEILSMEGAY